MKKPSNKPFVVEFKNRRRAATAPGRSIWNTIDLRKFDEPPAVDTPKLSSEAFLPADLGDAPAAPPTADQAQPEGPFAPNAEPGRPAGDLEVGTSDSAETREPTTGSRRRHRRAKADEELRPGTRWKRRLPLPAR